MDDKLFKISNDLSDVRMSLEQAVQISSVLSQMYFFRRLDSKEKMHDWVESSYSAVEALCRVIEEYAYQSYCKLCDIQEKMECM